MSQISSIESLIAENIPDAAVTVADPRGDGLFYQIEVVAPCFGGVDRRDQHRMVYAALAGAVPTERVESAVQLTTRAA